MSICNFKQILIKVMCKISQSNSEILKTVRYNPDNDYIQVYANGIWNNWQSVNLLFNGIYFNKSTGYNVPYLTGFHRKSLSYNSSKSSGSSSISLDSGGRIVCSSALTNVKYGDTSDHSEVPNCSVNTEFISNDEVTDIPPPQPRAWLARAGFKYLA